MPRRLGPAGCRPGAERVEEAVGEGDVCIGPISVRERGPPSGVHVVGLEWAPNGLLGDLSRAQ